MVAVPNLLRRRLRHKRQVVVFDREQVEQTVLLLRPYVDANDKTDLEYLSTLALADKLRSTNGATRDLARGQTRTAAQFDDQVDAARRKSTGSP